MIFKELIKKKRDGFSLTEGEIRWIVEGFTKGDIPPYQMAAFLMAVYFRGLNEEEMLFLTKAMQESGEFLNLKSQSVLVDKHSTGGIGDKVSLVLAPVVAEMGMSIAMLSGRGLGFTGGTADKLESTGMKVELSFDEIQRSLERFGFSISTQTDTIAPADRKIYSLRDATATVESIPLIVSSILSKKLSVNTEGIVFDVKVGTGAFMKTMDKAKQLAENLVNVSKLYGKKAAAVITEMSQPLGRFAGNSLEVKETVDALSGEISSDLLEVVSTLAGVLCEIVGFDSFERGKAEAEEIILSGRALGRFVEWVEFWGGSLNFTEAASVIEVRSERDGWISDVNGEKLGYLIVELGGGRTSLADKIDYSVGLEFEKKIGEFVKKGEILGKIYVGSKEVANVKEKFLSAYSFSDKKVSSPKIIKEILY